MRRLMTLLLCLWVFPLAAAPQEKLPAPDWQKWSPQVFERAKAQNKLILLNMEAVWCHWCHVMDRRTYANADVLAVINQHFIPVRVDQDSHPALSNRYEEYGWPATIILNGDGQELLKRRGFIGPQFMQWTLQALAQNPDPSAHGVVDTRVQAAAKGSLSDQQRQTLQARHLQAYDKENGAWGRFHKLIHPDSLNYSLRRAMAGDEAHITMARQTLDAGLALLDPVWGGVYQYSDTIDWQSPHYEKIIPIQTANMRHYAQAYSLWKNDDYLRAAREIDRYLQEHLMDAAGVFYTSQDADLSADVPGAEFFVLDAAGRKALGEPRVDKNIYARENGWIISALTALYSATLDKAVLQRALTAADWIVKNRSVDGGGFRHGEAAEPLFLGDSLAMGQAMLDLYSVTADQTWLTRAADTMDFIEQRFRHPDGGYRSMNDTSPLGDTHHLNSQVDLARFAARLHAHTGVTVHKSSGLHAMRYLASEDILKQNRLLAGVLLADEELSEDPLHITVVGSQASPASMRLFKSALQVPGIYRRVEWWDPRVGDLPRKDVTYPMLKSPAAFLCTNGACSQPIYDAVKLAETAERLR